MNKPQVLDHTDDFDHRISALESDMDTIKSNFEGLTGTLQKSFAKVEEDIQGIRDLIAKVILHTNERFRSMDDKIQSMDARIQSTQVTLTGQIQSLNDKMDARIQSLDDKIHSTRDDLEKSFRNDLRDFRREIKEDVRDSFNGFRWTVGIIVALAVAVMKLLP